jgi:hypothetical protein
VQDGLTHAVGVLLPLVLALPHVYVSYDLSPASLHVQLRQLLLANRLFSDVLRPTL